MTVTRVGFTALLCRRSACGEQLFDREPDVSSDLAKQRWRDVPTGMERNRSATPVGMSVLLVRAAMTDFNEAQPFKQSSDLAGPKNRNCPQGYATWMVRTPTNSDSSFGSPSSRSIAMTS